MHLITFTSDFGTRDYYAAVIKGALYTQVPGATVVDVTHEVEAYDIVRAAFIVRNTWKHYPVGTIHLVSVNAYYASEPVFVAIKMDGHYFIGPDNGLFSLVFDQKPTEICTLPFTKENDFPLKDLFSQAVAHLTEGKPFNELGTAIGSIEERISLQPVLNQNHLRGTVIHIDKYENVVLNITKDTFERVCRDREFALYFKRHNPIVVLSESYADVPVGDTLCLFNSAGYLEIAVNLGKAASLLGLDQDDTIQIDFL